MNFSGWVLLVLSWSGIVALAAFCFYKIFSKKVVK